MMWLGLLRRFWPVIAGAIALFVLLHWHSSAVREAGQIGYERARAEYQAELERDRQRRKEVDEETQRVHAKELAKVRSDAARELRGRPIHCRVLNSAGEVRTGRDPSEPPGGPGDEHAVRADVDLRPQIVHQGEACEQLRQQLIAIRERQEARRAR